MPPEIAARQAAAAAHQAAESIQRDEVHALSDWHDHSMTALACCDLMLPLAATRQAAKSIQPHVVDALLHQLDCAMHCSLGCSPTLAARARSIMRQH